MGILLTKITKAFQTVIYRLLACKRRVPPGQGSPTVFPVESQPAGGGIESPGGASALAGDCGAGGPRAYIEPQPSPPPVSHNRRKRNLVIGLDFGTSTTKVVWRDLTSDRWGFMRWTGATRLPRAALLPSGLAVNDSELYMAVDVMAAPQGCLLLPWIKMCVLCRHNPTVCRRCNALSSGPDKRLTLAGSRISADALACAFLSYVMRTVRTDLETRYPREELILQWNVGCPWDQLDSLNARQAYESIVHVAWRFQDQVVNPLPLEIVLKIQQALESIELPPAEERCVHVRPETLAGLQAFLQSPHADEGTYACVDIGAGTTEICFFLYGKDRSKTGEPFVASFLADRTVPWGGDDMDGELAKLWGVSRQVARKRKEAGHVIPDVLEVVKNISGEYRKVCCGIAAKRLLPESQRSYRLFFLGGGTRSPMVVSQLQCDFPQYGMKLLEAGRLPPPRGLESLANHFDLFAVATGLASTVLHWNYRPPHEMQPLPRPCKEASAPDRDELYPP